MWGWGIQEILNVLTSKRAPGCLVLVIYSRRGSHLFYGPWAAVSRGRGKAVRSEMWFRNYMLVYTRVVDDACGSGEQLPAPVKTDSEFCNKLLPTFLLDHVTPAATRRAQLARLINWLSLASGLVIGYGITANMIRCDSKSLDDLHSRLLKYCLTIIFPKLGRQVGYVQFFVLFFFSKKSWNYNIFNLN